METLTPNLRHKQGRIVKVLADTTNKRILSGILVFAFFTLLAIYVLAAFAVPETFVDLEGVDNCGEKENFKGLCHNLNFDDSKIWISYIGKLYPKNQFMLLGGQVTRFDDQVELNLELDYKIKVKPVDKFGQDHEETDDFTEEKTHTVEVRCYRDNFLCEQNYFMMYSQIQHEIYRVDLELEIPEEYTKILKGIIFNAKVVSIKYTNFLITLRYTFFAISILGLIFYSLFFCNIPKNLRTFEHKYIMVLSVSLVVFNDPFYLVTIYKAGPAMAFFSSFFVVQFVTFLIIFWVVMIRRIHKEPVRVGTRLLDKYSVVIGIIGFILYMITGIIASMVYRFNPGFHADTEYPKVYKVFIVFLILYCVIMVVLLLYNTFKIFKTWKKNIPRHKVFFTISFYFFFSMFLISLAGFYQSYDSNGVKILLLIFLNNFYILLLQIFWRFAPDDNKEFQNYLEKMSNEKMTNTERKKELGLNYFDEKIEINVSKKSSSQNSSQLSLTNHEQDLMNQQPPQRSITEIQKELEEKQKQRDADKKKFESIQRKFDEEDIKNISDEEKDKTLSVEEIENNIQNQYQQFDNSGSEQDFEFEKISPNSPNEQKS